MTTATVRDEIRDEHPIGLLLRNPREVARRCLEEEGLEPLAVASLAAIAIGAAVFGGVVGTFRGDAQIAYAALKMPLALLGALVLSVPAFHAIAASLGRAWPLRTVIALTLAAAGRAALVLLAFAPVLWLMYDLGLGYHAAALAAAGAYAVAGVAALGVLLRGLGQAKHKLLTAAAFIGVFLAAGGQTSWVLRPYLVRPQSDAVPFVRSIEGGFADALYQSSRSSMGLYDDAEREWDDARSDARSSDTRSSGARRDHAHLPSERAVDAPSSTATPTSDDTPYIDDRLGPVPDESVPGTILYAPAHAADPPVGALEDVSTRRGSGR